MTYAADASNVHRVCCVESGERFTLTMWFTKDPAHAEDPNVIASLQRGAAPSQRLGLSQALTPKTWTVECASITKDPAHSKDPNVIASLERGAVLSHRLGLLPVDDAAPGFQL